MKRQLSPLLALFASVLVLGGVFLALRPAPAHAGEVLLNGDFESWSGSTPANWNATGVSKSADLAVSGSAAAVATGGSLTQVTPMAGGALVVFRVSIAGSGSADVNIAWLDSGFSPLGTSAEATKVAGAAFNTVGLTVTAPITAAYAQLRMSASGGTVVFDSASLIVSLPESPTPEPPTATPQPTATPTSPASASATSSATASTTKTSTSAPTPTRTSRPSGSPPPATPPSSPGGGSAPPPDAGDGVSDPGPPPDVDTGGLLVNGGFELSDGTEPFSWSKFGGDMGSIGVAHSGDLAVSLISSTASTKWIYQVVGVTPGAWYEASAFALIPSSGGEAFVRISWYTASNGSGSAISDDDSASTTESTWTYLTTGPAQAPITAFGARVRLVLRPDGPSSADFDDAALVAVDAPADPPPVPSEPGSAATPSASPSTGETSSATSTPTKAASTPGASKTATPTKASPGSSRSTTAPLVGDLSAPQTLRISEVLPDPSVPGRDADNEWVELANAGAEPVDLAGWQIGDARELDPLPSQVVPPGGFVVIAASGATFDPGIVVVRLADGEIGSGLNNAGDTVRLIAPGGAIADTMSYGDDTTVFDPAPAAPAAGESIGVADLNGEPAGDNWKQTSHPTPGEPNLFLAQAAASTSATATAAKAKTVAGTQPASGFSRDLDAPVSESKPGQSPWPWVILAIALTIGAMTAAPYAVRILRRWRDGR